MLKDLDADHPLVYTLSLDAAGLVDLPAVPGASAPDITLDGTLQDVPLYARILAADLQGLPSGTYTQPLTVTVDY